MRWGREAGGAKQGGAVNKREREAFAFCFWCLSQACVPGLLSAGPNPCPIAPMVLLRDIERHRTCWSSHVLMEGQSHV